MPISIDKLPNVSRLKYQEIRGHIESGDILLCSGNAMFSKLIKFGTKSIWSHVAFIRRDDEIDRLMVYESVETRGVQIVPLSSYLYNYLGSGKRYEGEILIARHSDYKESMTHKISHHAIDMTTNKYGSGSIMKIAARIIGERFLKQKDCEININRKELICSEYAYECYQSVGIHFDHSCGYITPADIAGDKKVNPVCLLD